MGYYGGSHSSREETTSERKYRVPDDGITSFPQSIIVFKNGTQLTSL
jgi:hypothetical protein